MSDFSNRRSSGMEEEGLGERGRGRGRFSKFGRGKARVVEPEEPLNYKNVQYLLRFVTPTGRIVSRRRSNFSGQNQRKLARAIKHARHMALMPHVGRM